MTAAWQLGLDHQLVSRLARPLRESGLFSLAIVRRIHGGVDALLSRLSLLERFTHKLGALAVPDTPIVHARPVAPAPMPAFEPAIVVVRGVAVGRAAAPVVGERAAAPAGIEPTRLAPSPARVEPDTRAAASVVVERAAAPAGIEPTRLAPSPAQVARAAVHAAGPEAIERLQIVEREIVVRKAEAADCGAAPSAARGTDAGHSAAGQARPGEEIAPRRHRMATPAMRAIDEPAVGQVRRSRVGAPIVQRLVHDDASTQGPAAVIAATREHAATAVAAVMARTGEPSVADAIARTGVPAVGDATAPGALAVGDPIARTGVSAVADAVARTTASAVADVIARTGAPELGSAVAARATPVVAAVAVASRAVTQPALASLPDREFSPASAISPARPAVRPRRASRPSSVSDHASSASPVVRAGSQRALRSNEPILVRPAQSAMRSNAPGAPIAAARPTASQPVGVGVAPVSRSPGSPLPLTPLAVAPHPAIAGTAPSLLGAIAPRPAPAVPSHGARIADPTVIAPPIRRTEPAPPAIDVHELADHVQRILVRRAQHDRERRGLGR